MENETIKKAAKGDLKAFKTLFDFYVPRMRPVCLRYVRTDFEADDILQESFLKIFNNLKEFKFEGSFEGWVRRTVVHTAINHFNKHKTHHFLNLDDVQNVEEIVEVDQILDELEFPHLKKIIDELPEGYKIVFTLYVLEDYSHKEIANILNISEGTSRTQYAKSKKLIKKMLSRLRIDQKSSLIGKTTSNNENE